MVSITFFDIDLMHFDVQFLSFEGSSDVNFLLKDHLTLHFLLKDHLKLYLHLKNHLKLYLL